MNLASMPALCQGCGRTGPGGEAPKTPAWCRCRKLGRRSAGPFVAPPGFVARFSCEDADAAAFRERCRLVSNAEREARDALAGRWVRCGRGWRELPIGTPKRDALEAAYRTALRALTALQRECPHPSRSIFNPIFCDVCHAQVECNVEHYRHVVREIGKRHAARLAL